jgi:hypothetical protein
MAFDYEKGSLLVEFRAATDGQPTMAQFRHMFNLKAEDIDADYGLLSLDESIRHDGSDAVIRRTWMATVTMEAGERIERENRKGLIGVYSNYGRSNPPEM